MDLKFSIVLNFFTKTPPPKKNTKSAYQSRAFSRAVTYRTVLNVKIREGLSTGRKIKALLFMHLIEIKYIGKEML